MSQYHEKFLEAEEKATQLVNQLEELRKTAGSYNAAKDALVQVRQDLDSLIKEISSVVIEEQSLIKTLKEIDTARLLDEIEDLKSDQTKNFDLQLRQLSQLKLFFAIAIAINLIIGVLVVVLR